MFLNNKKATSIVEAMVVMFIVVSWVVWMYQVYNNSRALSDSTWNKIQAIQIAREWIEAMKNIRDTNWILYWSDTENCWNVDNYNSTCVWDNTTTNDITDWSYIIYQDTDNTWKINSKTTETSFNSNYRNRFKVWLDSNWFYTQFWATTEIKPIFTREIKITYPESEKMKVISLVQWLDSSWNKPHKVEFTSILTNWKK
jgi:archaellin